VKADIAIGFDYGARRIGVAIGNRLAHNARALAVVANSAQGPDWTHIETLVREWRPDLLLVGLPLTFADGEQKNSRAARAFAQALEQKFSLPLELIDERSSSREAAQRFAARRASGTAKRKQAADLDAVAAEIIVERWLNGV
jgi:putative holliday junction resolvase